MYAVNCPDCNAIHSASERRAGATVSCKRCGLPFICPPPAPELDAVIVDADEPSFPPSLPLRMPPPVRPDFATDIGCIKSMLLFLLLLITAPIWLPVAVIGLGLAVGVAANFITAIFGR